MNVLAALAVLAAPSRSKLPFGHMSSDFDHAIPVRQHQAVDREDGGVTVMVPRFTGRWARRLLVPLLARPDIRMHLDELGSAVWRACDGHATVADITAALTAPPRLPGDAGETRRRVHLFLRKLEHEGSLSFMVKEHD